VKATGEDDETIGDRANDELRITADEVRARVVGEGANLAVTQKARIQYARHGGRINADAIDNSAGVDTSDHEVNAKILLRLAEDEGRLRGPDDRDQLLHDATDHIVADVLRNCFLQTRALGTEVRASAADLHAYAELIERLEGAGLVDREVDDLPDPAELETRGSAGAGLTRPELAVLLSAAKRGLTAALLTDDPGTAIEEPVFTPTLTGYFPPAWVDRFGPDLLLRHRLRRELVATIVAKECVDRMGVPWAGARAVDHVVPLATVGIAWWMAVEITGARARWREIDDLDATLAPAVVAEMLGSVAELVDAVAARLLATGPSIGGTPTEAVARDREAFDRLAEALDGLGSDGRRRARARRAERLVDASVPPAVAVRIAGLADLGVALDAAAVGGTVGRDVAEVAGIHLALREELGLDAVASLLDDVPRGDHWTRAALAGAAADVRELAAAAVRRTLAGSPPDPAAVGRARAVIREVEGGAPTVASVTVAIRAVRAALG
jgi:glutamate dehydrogenase